MGHQRESIRMGEVYAPTDEKAKAIVDGFKINWMNMSDSDTGRVLWQSDDWSDMVCDREASIPKEVLKCRAVSREINFSSVELINGLSLKQRVFFTDEKGLDPCLMEEWNFKFGFVIPNSTNTWQVTVEAADEMFPAELLSGRVTIENAFFDDELLLCKSRVKIYY